MAQTAEPVLVSRRHQERAGAPLVSVCVSSRGRADLLPRLLNALENQDLPPESFEVVLVDNCSRDNTWATLQRQLAQTDLDLTVTRRASPGGPAHGRNRAWQLASAPVIAFTDDDCQPEPGWLRAGLAALEHAPIASGCTLPNPAHTDRRGPFSRTQHIESVAFVATCNVFYRRADLVAAHGFDEGFPTPGGEDTDLAWRLADDGREIAYAPLAIVHHDVSASALWPAIQTAWRWHGLPRMVALHPRRLRAVVHHGVFWKPSHPPTILALIGLAATPWWRPALLLIGPWLRYRWSVAPLWGGRRRRLVSLPGAFAIDTVEVAALTRGSVRERSLLL